VWTAPCACGRTTPRIRIAGRRDDMLRVQAVNVYPQAIGELLGGVRHAIVADGDPIVPPLHVYVEGAADAEKLRAALRTEIAVHQLPPGSLPVAEHKTPRVFRTARGDQLPDAIGRAHEHHD
jgi:phenylacetate-CoA ligase